MSSFLPIPQYIINHKKKKKLKIQTTSAYSNPVLKSPESHSRHTWHILVTFLCTEPEAANVP